MQNEPESPNAVRVLARRYCVELRRDFTALGRDWLDLLQTDPATGNEHDFCDANMTMQRAFAAVFGREPDLNDAQNLAVWNDAASLALRALVCD